MKAMALAWLIYIPRPLTVQLVMCGAQTVLVSGGRDMSR